MNLKYLVAICIVVVSNASLKAQQTYFVSQGESIQAAINSTVNGDTVEVAEGVFDESLFINKNITLRGAGPFKTIITGGDNGSRAFDERRSMLIYSAVVLDGIALIQPSRNVDQNHNSIGILLEAAGNSTIKNCRIENHITAIYISGSTNNLIEDNVLGYCGNGVLFASQVFNTDQNLIKGNLIHYNGAANETDDAGIKLISNYNGSNNLITENDIENNTIGINNLTTNTVDASGNWWGSFTGPNNTLNSDGLGNSVSGFVIFENWQEEVINSSLLGLPSDPENLTPQFSVYPNPTTSNLNLEYHLANSAEVSVTVYDLQGRQRFTLNDIRQPEGLSRQEINTTELESGVYLVKLTINGKDSILRFVKQ